MELAIDKRDKAFVVVDADTKKVRSVRYPSEIGPLRYIKLATGFPGDIRVMPVKRMWEKPVIEEQITFTDEENPFTEVIENPPQPLLEEVKKYVCEECGEEFEKPLAKARHIKIHKKEDK